MTAPERHVAFGLFKNEGPGRDVMLAAMFRYFQRHANPSSKRDKQTTNAKRLLLIYPRLISFESDRASGSARHGWRKERCQPWMAVCATHLHDHSQNAAGTRRAE